MPVVQITYDVPLDIAKGLATGELRTPGTAAVRDSTNIAAHIREASRTITDGGSPVSARLAKSLKDPKFIAFGLGVAVVAGAEVALGGSPARRARESPSRQPRSVSKHSATRCRRT